MTVRAALEILGIPTWHSVEEFANPPDIDMWNEALLAKLAPEEAARRGIKPFGHKEFDCLLSRWGATTDVPAAILCEELLAAYPDVKVILVERDVEKWYKSFNDTVIDQTFHPFFPLASKIDSLVIGRMLAFQDITMRYVFGITAPRTTAWLMNNMEAKRQFREKARETYRRHNEMVKRVVPKEKLLIMKLEHGWEPLCKHLGKPIPDVPFPHVNETQAMKDLISVYIANSYKRALCKFAKKAVPVLGVAVAGGVWLMRSKSALGSRSIRALVRAFSRR